MRVVKGIYDDYIITTENEVIHSVVFQKHLRQQWKDEMSKETHYFLIGKYKNDWVIYNFV